MSSTLSNPIVQMLAKTNLSSQFFNGSLEHAITKTFGVGSGSGQLDRPYRSNFLVSTGSPLTIDLASLPDPLDGSTGNAMGHWNLIIIENDGTSNQTITITGSPTGGTFTLTYNGQTTGNLAYNAAASDVQTALQALSTVGSGNVTVSGSAGGPFTAIFATSLGSTALTATASLTGGSTPGVTIAQVDISLTIGGGTNPVFAASPVTLQGFGDAQMFLSQVGKAIDASTAHNLKITAAGGVNVPGKLTIWGRST